MAKGLTFYVNSTAPSVYVTIKRGNYPVDLTGAIAMFQMLPSGSTTLAVNAACVIIEPPINGQVRYDWQPNDLSTIGNYLCNVFVTYPNGTVESTETTNLYVVDTIPPTLPNTPST